MIPCPADAQTSANYQPAHAEIRPGQDGQTGAEKAASLNLTLLITMMILLCLMVIKLQPWWVFMYRSGFFSFRLVSKHQILSTVCFSLS